MTRSLHAADALLPGGWARNVSIAWDDHGRLVAVDADAAPLPGADRARGPLLPGMPNLHSHAFQRGIAGLTEYRGQAQDSFWSWRTLMYRFALRLDPAQLEAIALWLYVEMLEAGYTSVCEFHYVHHDADGRPYADDATLVVKPGLTVTGKDNIRAAFVRIAAYVQHSLVVGQGRMQVIEGSDTALVIMESTLGYVEAGETKNVVRRATYVFRREADGRWLCTVDNSYGTDLLAA